MSNTLSQQATKASWALFEGLFIIAALVAVFATFIAISGVDPNNPGAGATPWLLGLNFIVIVVLAMIVVREYMSIQVGGRGEGKGRLARRFVLLFGFSALIPAMIVALFIGAFITRGLDNWLGERVDTIMEKNAQIFQDYVDNFESTLDVDVRLAALDVENFAKDVKKSLAASGQNDEITAENLEKDASKAFTEGLRSELGFREFLTIAVLGSDGVELIAEQSVQQPILVPPPQSAFEEANTGNIATTLYENRGIATALIRIEEPLDGYIYAVKNFDKNALVQLREAEAALAQYNNAKRRSGRLQSFFAIGYTQIAALILLLAGRLGLEAAGRITGPIGRLATAAHTVRDGDLTVRLPASGPKDEVYALTNSFNAMTEQLSEQRNALIRAREDSEDRRKFVETLLAEVSAGVIRMDGDMIITLANRSAASVLGVAEIEPGTLLADVAPHFESYARDTLERVSQVDASLDLSINGEIRHIRLKTAPDPAGGCVLTFDDTTRLVNAQRQLAWRDVARRIAHEIRNPLTPIMLSTERIRRRYADKIDDSDGVFDRCIETILRQVGDIGRMVEEFSSFARMPKPNVAPFNMRTLLQSAAFSQSVVSPDVEFDFESTPEAMAFRGDERLLGQAFGNLLQNAAEAIEGLPEESETKGHIRITLTDDARGVEVAIEDNGPGFPSDVRDRLLEPYVTTREKGTGLGLAIVNRIIADHGGSISLQNRLDGMRGARVRVWLPRSAPVALSAHDDAVTDDEDSHQTVRTSEEVEEPAPWR
ncbi:sensor histidine kinase [Hyphomonas johnsonii]|uniref:histidine kinase n=1 Tax=Hyphomonas johnsonii MHS-2 TaxID=1280950 RepID=A0A059FW31_9PROT|nr:ATP-binding protein [Hyphomonas johnsonii]KCZ94643.1 nitrogen regulation protein NtrY [Hyphomonas johnsonii MHS-2]